MLSTLQLVQWHIQIRLSKLGHYINVIIRFAFLRERVAPWNSFRLMGSMLILDRFPAFGRSRSRWGSLVEHCSVVCVRHRVSIALLDLQHTFRFFRKKKHFKVKENLWTVNRKTEFPDFSLTLTISKIFPDLKRFSVFPDFSLTVATLFMFLLSAAICPWFSN